MPEVRRHGFLWNGGLEWLLGIKWVRSMKPGRSLLCSHWDRAFPEESSLSPEAELRSYGRGLLRGQLQPIMFGTSATADYVWDISLTSKRPAAPDPAAGRHSSLTRRLRTLSRSTLIYLENVVNAGSLKQTRVP